MWTQFEVFQRFPKFETVPSCFVLIEFVLILCFKWFVRLFTSLLEPTLHPEKPVCIGLLQSIIILYEIHWGLSILSSCLNVGTRSN